MTARDELVRAAQAVCEFDWSDNDEDAAATIDHLRDVLSALTPPRVEGMALEPVAGAQKTALRWLRASIERAKSLAATVSGEGEHAEILETLERMLLARPSESADERQAVVTFLRDHATAFKNISVANLADAIERGDHMNPEPKP